MNNSCRYCRFTETALGLAHQGQHFDQAGNLDMVLLQDARTKKVYINVCNAIMTAQSESKPIKYCPYCGRKI